ncbi:hypothetical protein [Actinosynnema mirum]|uniref:Uncharacterized protein n=1 Tax=Actinosynnema mirum (strain ATCC 29888 / DSM 43827 / JCM 3225 / NBRC 14064 / NCIMB 13271 / NRRL B-12336 / IMRU 3971 / 101) TaxID=446462 RepID=C6WB14_ACTMD|nr:hypothetical protein [Actinosynnema mirum]ACU39305.1 hypothetical protein Amir_5487 [Actinosynnema mirum DSM 43827]
MTASDHLGDAGAWEEIGGELLAAFECWADERGVDVDHFVAQAAVDWRLAEGRHPGRWDVGDLRELLLVGFPRGVVMRAEQWLGVPATLHLWVDFLGSVDGGAVVVGDLGELHSEIDVRTPAFLDAMGDERNSGPAKFWVTRMREHGVDPDDQEENGRFLASVQAGEVEYDRGVLDVIMRRGGGEFSSAFVKPDAAAVAEELVSGPVRSLSSGAVEAAARESELLWRLRVLVEWVGESGRAVTLSGAQGVVRDGDLALLLGVDELREVALLVEWARALGVVRVGEGRVALGEGAALLERPVELWREACVAFSGLGHVVCPSEYPLPTLVGQFLTDIAPDLWARLYSTGGTPVPVAELVDLCGQALVDQLAIPGGVPEGWEPDLRQDVLRVAAVLVLLGAVEVLGDGEPDEVRATPLGLWGAWEVLRELGLTAA